MLADLLHQVVEAQETERQRIARELHDATGQALTAIALGLRGMELQLERGTDTAVLTAQVREIKSFSTNALGELRQIISDLRPPILDDMGLVAALKWYVHGFEGRRGIAGTFILEGEPLRLPSEFETVLFRIAQEALTNVAKHAGASAVTVMLRFAPGTSACWSRTTGEASTPTLVDLGGWGLLGMQERASLLGGQCLIDSKPGEGTRVWTTVSLPENRWRQTMTPVKLLLVDDHEIVRAGLRMLFSAEPDVQIVGEAASGREAIEQVAKLAPDVVLMDVAMPDMNGIEATRRIKEAFPQVVVLALTMHEDEEYFFEMLSAGASGYVPKRAAPDDLLSAIRVVNQGEVFIYPSMARLLVRDFLRRAEDTAPSDAELLTPREHEVLGWIAEGLTNREIAERLVISVKTVDRHRENIMRKLNLHNRVELVRYAIEKGLIAP